MNALLKGDTKMTLSVTLVRPDSIYSTYIHTHMYTHTHIYAHINIYTHFTFQQSLY